MRVRVRLTPPHPGAGRGAAVAKKAVAVVVDVLRATTTLTVALGHGARQVVPAATPEEAFALRRRLPGALLCGEREGRRIEGFDLGNSPFEYAVPVVADKTLVFASTNGSQALRAAAGARRRVLASFVNLRAVEDRLGDAPEVEIVCSGKLGGFALEDAACAGLLCRRLARRGARLEGATATLVSSLAPEGAEQTKALVQGSSHGRYLRSLGPEFARDVEFCAGLDTLDQAFEV